MAEADLLAVESNHCARLLEADIRRPWSTKQRISGRHGHLSNDGVQEILGEIASPRWRHICLTHLSRDCNSMEAVETSIAPLRGRLPGCEFSIVAPGGETPFINLV
jgi:phosphoribosyl 1,2-cyclic phosphodiesterase